MTKNTLIMSTIFILLSTVLLATPVNADDDTLIIVCTTSALGSVVEAYMGDDAEVVVLVRPGLCPADFDMKPSDVYAVSNAEILFKQNIPGEFWLQGLLAAAGNAELTQVTIPGAYNTPQGARNYMQWIGGNLSQLLDLDLSATTDAFLADVDAVASWMAGQSQAVDASTVKVVCMKWLQTFIESAGFSVVATYNPPETLSAGDIITLVATAQSEGAALIVDNLQIDVEFGHGIAVQVGAEHVVLTNFPGAIPNTGNLPQMFRYNAEQLYNATITWRSTATLRAERTALQNQVTLYQVTTSLAIIAAAVEAIWLYIGRKKA